MPTAMKTKQKSCVPCASAKRRCDLTTPQCARCIARGADCMYRTSLSPRRERIKAQTASVTSQPLVRNQLPILPEPLSVSYPSPQHSHTDLEYIVNPGTINNDDSFFATYDERLLTYPLPQIGVMERSRIRFLVKQLKSYPGKLVQTGRTPFIHPHLFSPSMHPSLQEAISASALYAAKDARNEDIVWEVLSNNVANLMLRAQTPWSLSSHLACVQALIIFQIIRLFDGEIRARSEGEISESVLVEWTSSMAARTSILTSPSTNTQNSWESWVFAETVARTVIVSLMVQAMYSIQKHGYCTLVDAVTELSFSAQKKLWEAKSALHWRRVYDGESRINVLRMEFDAMWEGLGIEDLDELGLLMMVTYNGVDGVNEWILKKGGLSMID